MPEKILHVCPFPLSQSLSRSPAAKRRQSTPSWRRMPPRRHTGRPHDIVVIPLDAFNEQSPKALDTVGPRLVHGLSGLDVAGDLLLAQLPEGDGGLSLTVCRSSPRRTVRPV